MSSINQEINEARLNAPRYRMSYQDERSERMDYQGPKRVIRDPEPTFTGGGLLGGNTTPSTIVKRGQAVRH